MRRVTARAVGPLFATLLLALALAAAGCGSGIGGDTAAGPSAASGGVSTTSQTPPSVTGTATYTFAVCGDNRIAGIDSGVLGRIVASAKSRGAAFIVDTGDVTTTGSLDELRTYRDFMEAQGGTFYSVPGNHDVGKGGRSALWEETLGPLYYSFDHAGDHFVILDNADDSAGIDAEQMDWYAADLDAHAAAPHTFVFAHIPVADPGLASRHVTGESGDAGLESGKRMAAEAKRARTAAFFFGHVHAYLEYKLDGIPAYVTGGAGAPLSLPEAAGGYYHYLLVKVSDAGVAVEVVRV